MVEKDKTILSLKGNDEDTIEQLFGLVEHHHQFSPPNELNIVNLFSSNIFEKRIVGFDDMIVYRKKHPDDAFILVSNHLSEADFVETMLHFMNHHERLLIQGGDNLFIDNLAITTESLSLSLDLDTYLRSRGAFQIIRKPKTVQYQGKETQLNQKDVLRLNKSYLFHLVEEGEFILQYPGQSMVDGIPKQGRTYTGMIDSFSRAIFQLLIEASVSTKKKIHIVPMNISYERVVEDEQFNVLLKMRAEQSSDAQLYMADLGYIIKQYLNPDRKTRLCIKFGQPEPMKLQYFWIRYGLGKKGASVKLADQYYDKVMSLQSPFPPNIMFTAMKDCSRLDMTSLKEKIFPLMERLDFHGADMFYLKHDGELLAPDAIIEKTFEIFGPRNIIAKNDGYVEILQPDVATQYVNHIAYLFDRESELSSSREEGKYEERFTIVRNLLRHNIAIEVIVDSTGLSREEVTRLQEDERKE
jgi:hypothetical protein